LRCFEPMRKDEIVTISQMRCKGHEEGSFIKSMGNYDRYVTSVLELSFVLNVLSFEFFPDRMRQVGIATALRFR
jgi:hypothetical protein